MLLAMLLAIQCALRIISAKAGAFTKKIRLGHSSTTNLTTYISQGIIYQKQEVLVIT